MPTLTRWLIKTALVYLVLALLTGAALAAQRVLALPEFLARLGPAYFHLLMVGWVTQLIFGVAHWMFPKFSPQQPRGGGNAAERIARQHAAARFSNAPMARGDERLMWAAYGLLNAGLIFRVAGEPLLADWSAAGPLVAVAAVLQWLAGLCAVTVLWGRVKVK